MQGILDLHRSDSVPVELSSGEDPAAAARALGCANDDYAVVELGFSSTED